MAAAVDGIGEVSFPVRSGSRRMQVKILPRIGKTVSLLLARQCTAYGI